MAHYLAEFFREGGPFMYVNLVFLTTAFATIVERSIAIYFRLDINAKVWMAQVQKLVLSNNVDRAIKLCNAAGKAALAGVVKAGLTRANRHHREIARALEEAVLEVTPHISKRIATLWSLANIATLVGLIGTITGLISTFKSLGAVSPEMKQLMLSKGISEAMNNTAFGLLIAAICIIGHMFLNTKTKTMIEELEFHAMRLENMLAKRATSEPPALERPVGG